MEITISSNRIYKYKLNKEIAFEVKHSRKIFNQAKMYAFNEEQKPKNPSDLSTHLKTKHKYNLNTYYTNDAVQKAISSLSSQKELNKLYIQQTNENIKRTNKKITNTKRQLTIYKKIKESIIKGKDKLKIPKNLNYRVKTSVVVEQFNRKGKVIQAWNNTYLFEHQHIEPKIKQLKAKIGWLKFKLKRLEQQLSKLESGEFSVTFGTKKLFKQQFTKEHYKNNHLRWLKDFRKKRFKELYFSGRADNKYGNFSSFYNIEKREFHFKSVNDKPIILNDVFFPYGEEKLKEYFSTQEKNYKKTNIRKSISYSLEDHGLYYLLKCSFDVTNETIINYSKADGVISFDLNVDHIAWADVSKDGNYLDSGSIYFNLEGNSSGHNSKLLEQVAIKAIEIAVKKNKPISMEDLKITLSKLGSYDNKKANFLKNIFAYRKLSNSIKSRANKEKVEVFEVNPSFTSVIGKLKYMRKFGISIHESAAFTIGRRALGYQEKIPKVFKQIKLHSKITNWKKWSTINKLLNVPKHLIYELYNIDKPHTKINVFHPKIDEKVQKNLMKNIVK